VPEPSVRARTLLAGRYRLESVVGSGSCTTLWWARDELLARPIAVKVLHAPGAVPRCEDAAEAIERFTGSAASVGRLAHPRIASTYDAGVDGETPYIVTEWVDGEAIASVIARSGPLSSAQAHTVAVQTAAALAYAHENGIPHGQVDGFNVLLCADGNVKLTDFGVASAVAPDRDETSQPERRSPAGQDVRAAAALLYLCLTGRSVNGEEPQLQPAPRREGALLSPSQVRAGVPRELDLVVMRTLGDSRRTGPPITDSAGFAAALEAIKPPEPVVLVEDDHTVVAARPHEPHHERMLRIGAPAVLAGVVVLAVVVGLVLGSRRPTTPRAADAAPNQAPRAAATSASKPAAAAPAKPTPAPVALPVTAARDFDPQGSPRTENPEDVAFAHDGNPATAWETDRYRTAAFGNLKQGVGVVFDLGRSVTVDQVTVTLPTGGTSFELRAGNEPGSARDDFAVVATAADAGTSTTVTPSSSVSQRYWLLWLTKIPPSRGGFKALVNEVAFTGQPPR